MISNDKLEFITVDNKEESCFKCENTMYPSPLTSLEGEWSYEYICPICLAENANIDISEIENLIESYFQKYNGENRFTKDSEWLTDGTVKNEMLEKFIRLESEDIELFGRIIDQKALTFKKMIEKGIWNDAEEEMLEYFNFYGNGTELVLALREIILKRRKQGINDRFYSNMYIKSRYGKLTSKEFEYILYSREFSYDNETTKSTWERMQMLKAELDSGLYQENKYYNLVKNVVTNALNRDYMTELQHYSITKFLEYIDEIDSKNHELVL